MVKRERQKKKKTNKTKQKHTQKRLKFANKLIFGLSFLNLLKALV